jgi:hypothetical protein
MYIPYKHLAKNWDLSKSSLNNFISLYAEFVVALCDAHGYIIKYISEVIDVNITE